MKKKTLWNTFDYRLLSIYYGIQMVELLLSHNVVTFFSCFSFTSYIEEFLLIFPHDWIAYDWIAKFSWTWRLEGDDKKWFVHYTVYSQFIRTHAFPYTASRLMIDNTSVLTSSVIQSWKCHQTTSFYRPDFGLCVYKTAHVHYIHKYQR